MNFLLASDAITIDSIFKNSNGLRSISSFNFISNGGSNSFINYPELIAIDDNSLFINSKEFNINETLLYGIGKFDILVSGDVSYEINEFFNENHFSDKKEFDFNSIWIGANYHFNSFYEFKPSLTLKLPLYEKLKYLNREKNFNFKSLNMEFSLKNFSDPLISTLSLGFTQNFKRKIASREVELPNSYYIGLDFSLILNSTISLNLSANQSFQNRQKENGVEVFPSKNLSNLGFGLTYSLNKDNSLSIFNSIGTSSDSPDNQFLISLWHKF